MYSDPLHGHPLRRLFAGLIEQVFNAELGVCDPRLTDYLGDLLTDFVHVDHIYRLRTVDGETIRDISRMQAEAVLVDVHDETERARQIHRYIGDFTLFWSGVYPESLQRRGRGGRLYEYLAQGKRGYEIAGELSRPGDEPEADMLRKLSSEFETCVHGLHLVRESWMQAARSNKSN
ncbi:MAG: hypothetical protein D6744_15345 [Planctomycetota bacterium]|nr:MAG: hypothetical protein D6744_15345 [Planctomycetota bacterium]